VDKVKTRAIAAFLGDSAGDHAIPQAFLQEDFEVLLFHHKRARLRLQCRCRPRHDRRAPPIWQRQNQ
jgi:hypothetical protein